MQSRGDIVVVARVESSEKIGLSVRSGYREPLVLTGSSAVLFAFQDDDIREDWLSTLQSDTKDEKISRLCSDAEKVCKTVPHRAKSDFKAGVTDILRSNLRRDVAAAALAVPFLHTSWLKMPIEIVLRPLRATAAEVSAFMHISDHLILFCAPGRCTATSVTALTVMHG